MRSTRRKAALPAAILAALVAAALAAPATAPAQQDVGCTGTDATPQTGTTTDISESLRCLLNQARADDGLRPLLSQRKVLRAATVHGNDMVNHHFVSHLGSNGSTPLSRVRRTGFLKGARFWAVGEDLAWGSDYQVTPANVARAWLNSPVHRRNILDGRFNRVGVGVGRGDPTVTGDSSPNSLTFVAVFAVVRR